MGVFDRFRTKNLDNIIFGKTNKKYSNSLINNIKLNESKGIVYEEPFKATGQTGKSVVEPQDKSWELYRNIYNSVPIAKSAIDHTSNFAIQSGYMIESDLPADKEKIEEFINLTNFDLVLTNVMRQMMIYGNAFLEPEVSGGTVTGIKILSPKSMRVIVSTKAGDNGAVLGYVQKVGQQEIEFKKEEIIHFKWNVVGNDFYGTSDLKSALGTIRTLLQHQEDIGEIIHRYGNPLLHHKLGTDESPVPSDSDRDGYIDMLEEREPGEDLVTGKNVNIEPIVANLKMIQPDGMLKRLENQLIAGFKVPEIFVRGGETSNKATADVELQAFDRNVKALREAVSRIVEDTVFVILGTETAKLVWNELSITDEATKAEIIQKLCSTMSGAGVPLEVAFDIVGWKGYIPMIDEYGGQKLPDLGNKPPGENNEEPRGTVGRNDKTTPNKKDKKPQNR